jgi:hypothetical protein
METRDDARTTDTITITEHHLEDLGATGADLRCTCSTSRRSSTPPAVLEVHGALVQAGFADDCLTVQHVTHTSDSGGCLTVIVIGAILAAVAAIATNLGDLCITLPIIGAAAAAIALVAWLALRSTQCHFSVRCADADAVKTALDLLGRAGKGIAVYRTDWRYEVDSAALGDWALRCIEHANARAERVAAALGVRIVGVHAYEESHELPRRCTTPGLDHELLEAKSAAAPRCSRRSAVQPAAFAPAHADSERGGAHVTVRYRVSGYAPKGQFRPSEAEEAPAKRYGSLG